MFSNLSDAYFSLVRLQTFILAVVIAIAAFMPRHMNASAKHDCCKKGKVLTSQTAPKPAKNNADCCEQGTCSPFLSCCCCGFLIAEPARIQLKQTYPADCALFVSYDEGYLIKYVGIPFQPPEHLI